jgi:hypothetical protein
MPPKRYGNSLEAIISASFVISTSQLSPDGHLVKKIERNNLYDYFCIGIKFLMVFVLMEGP